MSTPKEIFLETIKPNGQPERLLRQYEPFYMCLGDPVMCYLDGPDHTPGKTSVNPWGITISFPENAPGSMPVHGPGLTVCPDITRWKETVHAPDLAAHCSEGWEEFRAQCVAENNDQQMLTGFMATGIFEQCHFLMGFENTLTALYEHPDEMHELIEYITEYRMQYAKLVVENLRPEVMFTHDDWGTKDALFMKPEMWREFFKEPYRRFYNYFRSQGIITVHHADSYLVPIIDDMVEIGIQVWQGVLPENDIPALQRRLNGKLTLMGGLGAAIDRADSTPEEFLAYTKDTLRRCGPGGHYIPSITYGMFGTVFPHVDQYLNEGIDAYNADLHMPDMHLPPIPRRGSASAPAPAVSAVAEETQPLTLLAASMSPSSSASHRPAGAIPSRMALSCPGSIPFAAYCTIPCPTAQGVLGMIRRMGYSPPAMSRIWPVVSPAAMLTSTKPLPRSRRMGAIWASIPAIIWGLTPKKIKSQVWAISSLVEGRHPSSSASRATFSGVRPEISTC